MSARRLDLRGMAPPEPMLRILQELSALPPGESLEAVLPHEPVPLYGALEQRGWAHELVSDEPGACVVRMRRA